MCQVAISCFSGGWSRASTACSNGNNSDRSISICMTTAKCWIKYHLYIYPLALPRPASFSPLGLIQLQSTGMLFQTSNTSFASLISYLWDRLWFFFSSTFPSWLLFLWQGASFPWPWIKALYASQLAQRWDSFICWLLSASWVTSGKIAVFVCVSVCVCARVCTVKVRNLGSTLRCLCVSWTPACCLSLFVGHIHSWSLSWHWWHNTWH